MELWWSNFVCCKARDKSVKDDGEWMEPILPDRRSSDSSATKEEEEEEGKKADATTTKQKQQCDDLKTPSKKSVRWSDGKSNPARWVEPVKEKSIRWADLVDNLPDASIDQISSSNFDEEVIDSVMNSVMRDDYRPRGSMLSMGSLYSEDSVSRALGGFNREGSDYSLSDDDKGYNYNAKTQESWGSLEDDECIPVIVNVSVIGSITSAIRNSISFGLSKESGGEGSSHNGRSSDGDSSGLREEAISRTSSSSEVISQINNADDAPETTPEAPAPPDTSEDEEATQKRRGRNGWSF